VVAVCDRSETRCTGAAEIFGARPYSEAHELIENNEVQPVVVSAPSNLHSALAIAALDAGKDVVEKPRQCADSASRTDTLASTNGSGHLGPQRTFTP